MNKKKKKRSSADERGSMKNMESKKPLVGQTSRVPPCAHANPVQTKKGEARKPSVPNIK